MDKINNISELLQSLGITKYASYETALQLYGIRDYIQNNYGYSCELHFMEGINLYKYKLIDINYKRQTIWSDDNYEDKYDCLIDGLIKLLTILNNEKGTTI